jgi:glycosyltransferase involved in cell wall biosynthesis
MKIALFTDAYWPRVNGVTVSVDSFAHALVRAGHQVIIVCPFYPDSTIERITTPDSEAGQEEKPIVIRVPSIRAPFLKEDRMATYRGLFWLTRQLEAFRPDIVHINTEFIIADFGFIYAKLHNTPIVYTFHTMWEDYVGNYFPAIPLFILKFLVKRRLVYVMRLADQLIAPSMLARATILNYKVKKKIHLLPTGIDPALFTHEEAEIAAFKELLERRYPLLRGKRILLFAGRIAKEKNVTFLLDILPAIVAKQPAAVLLMVGNGPALYPFQEEAERRGLRDHCVCTGYLDRRDLSLVYAIADLFVFPSLTETQGMVTIEAMISGLPVVAIGEMGTIMVMGGDNGGFMVKNDPAEFTARVLELLEDGELLRRKRAEARIHAKNWTIDTQTVKLQALFQAMIDGTS